VEKVKQVNKFMFQEIAVGRYEHPAPEFELLVDCKCAELQARVGELEIIVLKIMFPKDYQDEFLTGQQAKLVSEIHKEALKEV